MQGTFSSLAIQNLYQSLILTNSRNLIFSKFSFQQMSGNDLDEIQDVLLWGYLKESFLLKWQSVANVHSHYPLLASTLTTLHKLPNYLLPIPQQGSLHSCWIDSSQQVSPLPVTHSLTVGRIGKRIRRVKARKNLWVEIKSKAVHSRKT